MNYFSLWFAFGFWASIAISTFSIGLCFIFVYSLFMYFRFKRKFFILIWVFCSVFALGCIHKDVQQPKLAEYTIYEIKPNYCLARNENTSIVLYGIENPHYYDVYKINKVEPVQSIRNIDQFSFSDYLKKQKIFYFANVDQTQYVRTIPSFRNRVFTYLSNHVNSEYYLSNFYGILKDDASSILSNLGLAILGSISIINNILRKKFSFEWTQLILFIILVLYGSVFTFTPSLVRIILFEFSKIFFSKWEYRFSLSVCLFCVFLPNYALEFIFLLPVSAMILYHFCKDMFKRIVLVRVVLAFFQLMYFHEVNLVLFLMFGFLRKLNSFIFLFSFLGFFLPDVFNVVLSFYHVFISKIPLILISYVPNIVFVFVFFILLYRLYNNRKVFFVGVVFCMMILCGDHLNPFFNVYMIDIGQGDCTLITEPFLKSAVLIDCGQNLYRDNVEEIIYPVLKDHNISKLDALIITHNDFDHSGGLENLSKVIEIETIITDSSQKVDVDYPFYSLLPDRISDNENDSSIISYFSYDQLNYLWMADAGVEVEKQLMDTYHLDVDILKLGHHGSNTSSSYAFLDYVRPTLGLVSVGNKNRYNHPSSSVVSNCHQLGIDLLMTKDVGMVHIFTLKGLSFFRTGSNLFGIINA